jgi:diguanylate cyclase (GGDEF)-like protein
VKPVLPVGPILDREDPAEREARTAALHVLAAFALGATLAKAARDQGLPWWWVNLPLFLLIGSTGAAAGAGAARAADAVAARMGGAAPRWRFWVRYGAAFATDTLGFAITGPWFEGRSLWRGSSRFSWSVGWPLAVLMLATGAIDTQASERVRAVRGMLLNPVTDLRNRRMFDSDLAALVRDRVGFTLVAADLNGLKHVNDTHGHAAGDAAVKALGAALGRQVGFAYHWGGDEFMLLLAGTERPRTLDTTRRVAEELRSFESERGFGASASFGCTFVPETDTRSPEAIQKAADEALYRAKGAGRSRLAVEAEAPVDLL